MAEPSAPEVLASQLLEQLRLEAARERMPRCTYRVQLNRDFNFEKAQAHLRYWARLGVSDLYCSPYLKANPGSLHGYDVVDYRQLNPEIGDEQQHEAFCQALQREGLGHLVDFVSNHMGVGAHNPFWLDVLENGPASAYAHVFDVDWKPVKSELENKVLLPILGDQYGVVLENGELKLELADGALFVRYYETRLPVAPAAYRYVLRHRLEELEARVGSRDPGYVELASILTALEHLPPVTATQRELVAERNREKEVIKRRLAALVESSDPVRALLDENVRRFNGAPGEPSSFDLLDQVLSDCCYRLAYWRVAGEEINYRRFFDVNSLAAIRVEDPGVFELTHQKLFEWLSQKKVTGLRIDHPDGLFDPCAYLLDLQERYVLGRARALCAEGTDWPPVEKVLRARFREEVYQRYDSPLRRALYVLVEKIQGGRERIPEAWAVHGTTGYRFANAAAGVLVDRDNEAAFTALYERFIGRRFDYTALCHEKKRQVLEISMGSELNVLARELNQLSELNRRTRDFTLNSLRRALIEVIAHFPVYRTYVDDLRPAPDEHDLQYISAAVAQAIRNDPATSVTLYQFLEDILLRRDPVGIDAPQRRARLRFAMRFQQLTGPVMAKGLEDTTFYVYNRLLSLNEVGGEPDRFGTSPEEFHERNLERLELFPNSLLATSTHDTKRSEDVRCRLHVLSELPAEWEAVLGRLTDLASPHRTWVADAFAPTRNDEYLFYQTVLGVYPMGPRLEGEALAALRDRVRQYMQKATREAKENTSWVSPRRDYEEATSRFVDGCLSGSNPVHEELFRFKERLERPGQLNSLSVTLLKLASPGVVDLYQGCELWSLTLVDPDNREPVDFELRRRLLGQLEAQAKEDRVRLCHQVAKDMTDGRAKLYLLAQGLTLRRQFPELFCKGEYLPLELEGDAKDRAVAFARHHEGTWALAVAPRLNANPLSSELLARTTLRLPEPLRGRFFESALTGSRTRVRPLDDAAGLGLDELWADFPVALLYSTEP